jgi:hypothetical protein
MRKNSERKRHEIECQRPLSSFQSIIGHIMSQFAVQVYPLDDIRDDDFSRFALRMTGAQSWNVEQASFTLRVGYAYFGTKSEADDAAAKLSGSSLNGVAVQLRSVVLVEDDFGFVVGSQVPVPERRSNEDNPKQQQESRPAPPNAANSATPRTESGHRHHHRRKPSSYSSSSYSSSSDSPNERSHSSHRSHHHHHHHYRHHKHHKHHRDQK